jgi:hypothetical protein
MDMPSTGHPTDQFLSIPQVLPVLEMQRIKQIVCSSKFTMALAGFFDTVRQ